MLVFPGARMLAGTAVILVVSDLRARVEERLLVEGFGERYREYAARVSRFLPGVY